jgi:hypothetical protein
MKENLQIFVHSMSTLVEYLLHHPKVEGLSTVITTGTGRKNGVKIVKHAFKLSELVFTKLLANFLHLLFD